MTIANMTEHGGEWLRGTGPHNDVVISSRVRLARNLAGFPFTHRANERQRTEILERCQQRIFTGNLDDNLLWVDMNDNTQIDRQLLVERHLISRQLAKNTTVAGRAAAISPAETFSIMVNEEDHLRIQVLRSGLQLSEAFQQISTIDDSLEQYLDFAYSRHFGYLTACPTNIGTGIRVSVMLHLPALKLTGEIDKVQRAARDLHLAVRGLFGEGSEAYGDLYQISNQTTLGRTEQEILDDFERSIVPQIIAYEQQARQALVKQRPAMLDDKIWRAWATLTHARLMGTEEVLALLSHLRLGIFLGRIDAVDVQTINDLFLLTQPAHLQKVNKSAMDPAQRREARARLIRQHLGAR